MQRAGIWPALRVTLNAIQSLIFLVVWPMQVVNE